MFTSQSRTKFNLYTATSINCHMQYADSQAPDLPFTFIKSDMRATLSTKKDPVYR